MPSDWNGELDRGDIVKSWDQLMKMYTRMGMVQLKRYRMCVGTSETNIHDAIILEPINEDAYEGDNILKCKCNPPKIKRDCDIHAETCTSCNNVRKNMIPIDYSQVADNLKNLMRSKTYCEKMLTLWKNRDRWMVKDIHDGPLCIKIFGTEKKLGFTKTIGILKKNGSCPFIAKVVRWCIVHFRKNTNTQS
jgi:hypothetical protein